MSFSLKQKFSLILKKKIIKKLVHNYKITSVGRNLSGKITVRHRGKIIKKSYRVVDFYRSLMNIRAIIYTYEYDPFRNTLLSLLIYTIGIFSYILGVENTIIGSTILSTYKEKLTLGSSTLLSRMKINTKINCIELGLYKGAKLSRSSGVYAKVVKKTNLFVVVKLKSNKLQKINKWCFACLGSVLNFNFYLFRYKKAGLIRLQGYRPCVRGVAMNPIDHPYGGGEGKKSKKAVCMSP